jgi:hypothetical protein
MEIDQDGKVVWTEVFHEGLILSAAVCAGRRGADARFKVLPSLTDLFLEESDGRHSG